MKRRKVIHGGLLLAAGLLVEGPAETAPSGLVSASFFEGQLGDDFSGWVVHLVLTGRRAAGLAYDPASVDRTSPEGEFEPLRGLRLKGTLGWSGLTLAAYGMEDLRHAQPVGVLTARLRNGAFVGKLRLADRRRGPVQAAQVVIAPESLNFVGQYRGSVVDPAGRTLYTGLLTLTPDLAWELREIVPAEGFPALTAGTRLTGRWGVKPDGGAVLSVTQVPVPQGARQSEPGPAPRVASPRSRPLADGSSFTFEDGEFADANWAAEEFAENPPTAGESFRVSRVEQGGNPGAFRRLTHLTPQVDDPFNYLEIVHYRTDMLHTRGGDTEPVIAAIRLRFEWKALSEAPPTPHGIIVHTPPGGPPAYYLVQMEFSGTGRGINWETVVSQDYRHFLRLDESGAILDLNAEGTFQFGFMTTGHAPGVVGVDSFRVEVTLAPPPPPPEYTFDLEGPSVIYESALTALDVDCTAIVRLRGGGGVPGVQVAMSAHPQNGVDNTQHKTTDGGGTATFTFQIRNQGDQTEERRVVTFSATARLPSGMEIGATRMLPVEPAGQTCEGFCAAILFLSDLAPPPPVLPSARGVEGFCAEHPLLPGHLLCAEPL